MTKKFDQLSNFIQREMRMSHVYQPVMLIELLSKSGSASATEIATALAGYDEAQIEYYEQVVKNMVGRVLTKNRGITAKDNNQYSLVGYDGLNAKERAELIKLCESKINEFMGRRGSKLWDHRRKTSGNIPGTLRYIVLSRAKRRCELCGISADEKALQVDHIVPRNHGGTDDISNLQALCYTCNAMKRDRDDTDFRGISDSYKHREAGCIFCETPKKKIIAENDLSYAIRDAYPVTELHTLIIPKRHVPDYFSLYRPEQNAMHQLLEIQQQEIRELDKSVTGFNIGNNSGVDAGQTVMHCHTHLIPRRTGDTVDPTGGVRGVIPERQRY